MKNLTKSIRILLSLTFLAATLAANAQTDAQKAFSANQLRKNTIGIQGLCCAYGRI